MRDKRRASGAAHGHRLRARTRNWCPDINPTTEHRWSNAAPAVEKERRSTEAQSGTSRRLAIMNQFKYSEMSAGISLILVS